VIFYRRAILQAFLICISCALQAQQNSDISPALRKALKHSISQASSFTDRFDAEVWLIDMSGRIEHLVDNRLERINILKAAHAQASIHKLPIDIVLGLI
jgi:uncharacterized protein YeaO (DUF488 family)